MMNARRQQEETVPSGAELAAALRAVPGFSDVTGEDLAPLPSRGIAHDHWAVSVPAPDGLAVILRVARLSQWAYAPERQLDYEATAFARAAPSGVTPRLVATLPVSRALPWGALVVEHIGGGKPSLPGDMAAIARCLAALHALPVPAEAMRAPLQAHTDPIAGTLAVIRDQARYVDRISLSPASVRALQDALRSLDDLARSTPKLPPPLTLVGTDTHPGNYLVPAPGRAVFVDLEKAMYANPAGDLAHATLYTSTRWDPDIDTSLGDAAVDGFLATYSAAVPHDLGAAATAWFPLMRRLIWLRTTTWCVRWAALELEKSGGWRGDRLPRDQHRHIRRLVADFLSPERLAELSAKLAA